MRRKRRNPPGHTYGLSRVSAEVFEETIDRAAQQPKFHIEIESPLRDLDRRNLWEERRFYVRSTIVACSRFEAVEQPLRVSSKGGFVFRDGAVKVSFFAARTRPNPCNKSNRRKRVNAR